MTRDTIDKLLSRYARIINPYTSWLASQDSAAMHDWTCRTDSNLETAEAAIAEAAVWSILSQDVAQISLDESRHTGGLDFRCVAKSDEAFCVEVCNVSSSTLSRATDLPPRVEEWKGGSVGSLARIILNKRRDKQDQIRRHSIELPVLLAITGFHETATFVHFDRNGTRELLTPITVRKVPITSREIGFADTWEEPLFEDGCFFRLGDQPYRYQSACPNIAAIMLFAVPWSESETGKHRASIAVNPMATHEFDHEWLPSIPTCRLDEGWGDTDPCEWAVQWNNT